MPVNLYAGNNTILVELTALTNGRTAALINDATVECTMLESASGEEVGGDAIEWPITMDSLGSGGNYEAVISADTDIDEGKQYTITISVTSGENVAEFSEKVRAKARTLSG